MEEKIRRLEEVQLTYAQAAAEQKGVLENGASHPDSALTEWHSLNVVSWLSRMRVTCHLQLFSQREPPSSRAPYSRPRD